VTLEDEEVRRVQTPENKAMVRRALREKPSAVSERHVAAPFQIKKGFLSPNKAADAKCANALDCICLGAFPMT